VVVDFFRVTGKDGKPVLDEGIWARVEGDIKKVLNKEKTVEELLNNRRKIGGEEESLPGSEPAVKILNDESFDYTVIEITAQDRLGLLYDLTRVLSDMQTNIASAHITTEGHMAINSIYINEANGRKIENRIRLADIRQKLFSAIDPK
jgi:[protein-PII] uridylyltransferase